MLFEGWLEKIQQKKKNQSIRDLIFYIASWYSLVPSKDNGSIGIFPKTSRKPPTMPAKKVEEERDWYLDFWINYDWEIWFFECFNKLFRAVPQPNLIHFSENPNSEYAHCVFSSKNVYMGFTVIEDVENCLYSFTVKTWSRNVLNSLLVWEHSDNVFCSKWIIQSYNIFYSKYIFNSANIWFSTNLTGCEECLFCENLDNKKYCIQNKEYTKEDYLAKKKLLLNQKDMFDKWFAKLSNQGSIIASNNVEWNFIVNSENVESGYCVYDIKDAKNVIFVWWRTTGERIFDTILITPPFNDAYGVMSSGTWCSQVYNSIHINWGSYIFYSQLLTQCSYCLWCIGLKNKSYCIFNKQYTKEDWYKEVDKIFSQMDKEWTLGDFFPWSMNPFYFNDTVAYLIDPSFTKEEVIASGYLWRDEPIKVDIPASADLVNISELWKYEWFDDTNSWIINPDILKKIIVDEQWNYYRIVNMEYDFLVKHWLPLPRKHRLDRLKDCFVI